MMMHKEREKLEQIAARARERRADIPAGGERDDEIDWLIALAWQLDHRGCDLEFERDDAQDELQATKLDLELLEQRHEDLVARMEFEIERRMPFRITEQWSDPLYELLEILRSSARVLA